MDALFYNPPQEAPRALEQLFRTDGEAIDAAIRNAEQNPVHRPVDARKLKRSANLYKLKSKSQGKEIETVVSVPEQETEDVESPAADQELAPPTHTEIQWRLLDLGSRLGLGVWAPRADRGRSWDGRLVGKVANMFDVLPPQFNHVANKTIEQIDVLWLSRQADKAIVAAFEVEHTTSVYSGLLRMSDLLTVQPNITIKFYLVAPDDRLSKFTREIARPTFASREKPLHSLCSFLPYSALCSTLDTAKDVLPHLKPEFLDSIAESYDPAEEVDA